VPEVADQLVEVAMTLFVAVCFVLAARSAVWHLRHRSPRGTVRTSASRVVPASRRVLWELVTDVDRFALVEPDAVWEHVAGTPRGKVGEQVRAQQDDGSWLTFETLVRRPGRLVVVRSHDPRVAVEQEYRFRRGLRGIKVTLTQTYGWRDGTPLEAAEAGEGEAVPGADYLEHLERAARSLQSSALR
jgi:hypothetical protein